MDYSLDLNKLVAVFDVFVEAHSIANALSISPVVTNASGSLNSTWLCKNHCNALAMHD